MSIPTLEEKLEWLKPIAATQAEREAAAKVGRGNYEIGVQRTAKNRAGCAFAGAG